MYIFSYPIDSASMENPNTFINIISGTCLIFIYWNLTWCQGMCLAQGLQNKSSVIGSFGQTYNYAEMCAVHQNITSRYLGIIR